MAPASSAGGPFWFLWPGPNAVRSLITCAFVGQGTARGITSLISVMPAPIMQYRSEALCLGLSPYTSLDGPEVPRSRRAGQLKRIVGTQHKERYPDDYYKRQAVIS
jgi:hypothetical protein